MDITELNGLINQRLDLLNLSARQASIMAVGHDGLIRDIRNNRMPSFTRVCTLLDVLGLNIVVREKSDNIVSFISQKPEHSAFRAIQRYFEESSQNGSLTQPVTQKKDPIEVPAWALDADNPDAPHGLVPKLSVSLSAGMGADASDERVEYTIAFRKTWLRKHGLQMGYISAVDVDGDSMLPALQSGETVLVDHKKNTGIKRGTIVAALVGDEAFVKRYMPLPDGQIMLQSDNSDYEPIILSPDDKVVGTVVWKGVWI